MKLEKLAMATLSAITFAPLFFQGDRANAAIANWELRPASETAQVQIFSDPIILNRAKNYARQAAERINGGLSNYRAEPAMHGFAADSPYVDNGDGTWTFVFRGGRPGSDILDVETVVTVAQDGEMVNIDYNGPVRE